MAQKRRRKDLDLRDFWPWYERSWPVKGGFHAQRPPFELGDLSDDPPLRGRWILQVLSILVALLLTVFVIWGMFMS